MEIKSFKNQNSVGIIRVVLDNGDDEILDLSKLKCSGFVCAQAPVNGTVNLKASHDGSNTYGSQNITATAAVFTAVGPYGYLHVSYTGTDKGYITIQ